MRLAWHTDYGLRTLMFLAAADRRATISEVAEFFQISRDHVAKVVQRLAREGFIRSVRGVGGGLELAHRPAELRLGDVIRRLEGATHLLDCVPATRTLCVIQGSCRLRGVLAEAERRQLEYLNSITLADVAPVGPLVAIGAPEP